MSYFFYIVVGEFFPMRNNFDYWINIPNIQSLIFQSPPLSLLEESIFTESRIHWTAAILFLQVILNSAWDEDVIMTSAVQSLASSFQEDCVTTEG